MGRVRRTTAIGILIVSAAFLASAATAESDIDRLAAEVDSDDLLSRHRAQVELRNRGSDVLEPLAAILREPVELRPLRLEAIFRDNLAVFLDELESDTRALLDLKDDLDRLQKFVAGEEGQDREDVVERVEELRQQIDELEPRLKGKTEFLERLGPIAHGEILKRAELVDPVQARLYLGFLDKEIAERGPRGLRADPDSKTFDHQRYLLSPLWLRATAFGDNPEIARLLERHLEATFADLRSPNTLVRERAEDDFYMLGRRGLEFLRASRADAPIICDRLVPLLDWRIHPRLRERTSMDFRGYREMDFRRRREHLIRYARTAGREAIPTLRLLVLDDQREPSIRVKLTAAEQLAGLRDNTGIAVLTKKPLPELMKIPEISRDFFILKGIQYQEEKKYDLAVAEFQKVLNESPFHFQANYRIAFVYLLDKKYKKSIHHFEIARKIRPDDMLTLYNLSCAYSLDGQVDNALDMLEASVEAGFNDVDHIEKDPDITPLRGTARYRKLIENLKRAN